MYTHTHGVTKVHTQGLVFPAEDSADFSTKCRVHALLAINVGGEFGRRIKFMEFLAELMNRCS